MRLRQAYFLWIALASVVPLAVLTLGAIAWGEWQYRKTLDSEISTSLDNIVSDLARRLRFDREILKALGDSRALKKYMPVLTEAAQGNLHEQFFEITDNVNQYLAEFQTTVQDLDTIRILDISGNALIKINAGQFVAPLFDGIESFPYAEAERDDEELTALLNNLPDNEVSYLNLERRASPDSLLESVMPLRNERGQRVGYLSVQLLGAPLDNILELSTRLYNGTLKIVEINTDQLIRNRMVLYHDRMNLKFLRLRPFESRYVSEKDPVIEAYLANPHGSFDISVNGGHVWYQEYLPYPNELVSWVVSLRIKSGTLYAPFIKIRWGVIAVTILILLVIVLVARLGADRISQPVTFLARRLKAFADGERGSRLPQKGPEELKELTASFNYLAETLERAEQDRDQARNLLIQQAKLASTGQLAAGIGHELNNPLNNILSITKLMERDLSCDKSVLSEDLGRLRSEAMRATDIVRGILNFSRQTPLQYSYFAIEAWLLETLELVKRVAMKQQIQLDLKLDHDLEFEGDRSQLQQALINLLLNAIQASPGSSTVTLDVACDENELTISVHDQGTGIPEEFRSKVFDPFFTTKTVGEGTGLGLSIAFGIIEQHGGSLVLNNNEQGGTLAAICLPLHRPNVN